MALSEVKISPQDDLVAALAATPKKGTLVLAKGVYTIKECLIVDKTVTLKGETGDPKDVVISRVDSTVLLVVKGKPRFTALTFQAPKNIVDAKIPSDRPMKRDPIEYKSAVAIREEGNATFENCIASSGTQSGFSVRGKKARVTLSHCHIRNTGEGGIFFDDRGRGVIENTIIENSGLGCVDVEENGYVEVKNSKLLGSRQTSISLHNFGNAKFVECEVCGGSTSCGVIVEKSQLTAIKTTFYSHVSKSPDGDPDFSADGILVSDSYLKLVKTEHYATRFGVAAEEKAKIVLKSVTIGKVFASVIAQSQVKIIQKGDVDLCVPPYVGGHFDERGSRIVPGGVEAEPDSDEYDAPERKEYNQDEIDAAYVVKDVFLRKELGAPWPLVLHAAAPFSFGGVLDGYYYPNTKYGGVFMVSKEIATPDFDSPNNNTFRSYELAIATRDPFPYDNEGNVVHPESVQKYRRLHKLLTNVGHYVEGTSNFNRYDSIALPEDYQDPDISGAAFVTDAICFSDALAPGAPLVRPENLSNEERQEYEETYPGLLAKLAQREVPGSIFDDRQFFGVVILIEVHQSEIQALLRKELSREEFVNKLKEQGEWPFSDLNRRPPLL